MSRLSVLVLFIAAFTPQTILAQNYILESSDWIAGGGRIQTTGLSLLCRIGGTMPMTSPAAGVGVNTGLPLMLVETATLALESPPSTAPRGESVVIRGRLLSPGPVDSHVVSLRYRIGGASASTFTPMALAEDLYVGSIPAAAMGDRGVEYYLETQIGPVTLVCPAVDNSKEWLARIDTQLQDYDASGDLASAANQHRMIGFSAQVMPATIKSVLEDDLGSADKREWRLGRWDPVGERYREYLGSEGDIEPIAAGRAYWLITRSPQSLDFSGLSQAPSMAEGTPGYELALKPGWNQISNPFAFDVDPAAIQVVSGGERRTMAQAISAGLLESKPLRGYDPTTRSYPGSNVFKPWTGYFVNNADGAGREMVWAVPFRAMEGQAEGSRGTGAATHPTAPSATDWTLEISATDARGSMRSLLLGLAEAAQPGLDPSDELAPPRPPGDGFALYSVATTPSAGSLQFTRDVRSPGRAGTPEQSWDIIVVQPQGGPVRLGLSPATAPPGGTLCRLVDTEMDRLVDLAPGSCYEFVVLPGDAGRALTVHVGSKEYLDSRTRETGSVSSVFALQPILPNPLRRGHAFVRFTLAENGPAQLSVHDVTGRLIYRRGEEILPRGGHIFEWDGRNQAGDAVAAGAYYLQLRSGSHRQTEKLLVVR